MMISSNYRGVMTKKTKILTVANRKGGAGKSTCAAHLALEAVNSGLKTLLIDLDPQGTLETWWKKRKEENPWLAEVGADKLEEVLQNSNKHGFDICIIDTPGDTSLNALTGIKVADLVLIPSRPTGPDLSAIGRTISIVKQEHKEYIFLLTQATPNPRAKAATTAMGILSGFGEVVPTALSSRTSYANAMNGGISAAALDKSAQEELSVLWQYVQKKLFSDKNIGDDDGKAKIRLN